MNHIISWGAVMPIRLNDTAVTLSRRGFLILLGAAVAVPGKLFASDVRASGRARRQPLPDYLIAFTSPDARSRGYRRFGVFHHVERIPFTVEAVLRDLRGREVKGLERGARLLLLRGRGQEVVARGEWSRGPDYTMLISEDPGSLEPLVVAAEVQDEDTWVIARPIHIGEQPPPDQPRWMAIGAQRFRHSDLNTQGVGYVWYPGHEPEHSSTPFSARPGGRIDHLSASADDYHVQRMTVAYTVGGYYPEFNINARGDVAAGIFRMQYNPWNSHAPRGLETGLFRDGPRNVGSIGYPCAGFVDEDESCIICSAPGRIARVDLHGNTTTLVGWRFKPGALAPMARESRQFVRDQCEFVGTLVDGKPWAHIWDVVKDPDHPNHLYIADADNHCIRRFDLASGELSIFAGSVNAEAGFVDAPGHAARFNRPRGLAIRDRVLYVGDALNHAIREIDMNNGEVGTLVQSADMHHAAHIHHDHGEGLKGAREWVRDGAFGRARFMHPLHVRFASDGCLLSPMHHQLQMLEFNLETRQVRTLIDDLPASGWRRQMATWMTLDIDDGSFGPKDTLYYTGWGHRTDRVYTRDGDEIARIATGSRPIDSTGFNAPLDNFRSFGYSQLAVCGRGAVWVGGVSGAGVFRITPRQPDDPRPDPDRFERGMAIWRKAPHPLAPSLSLIHGPWGMNGFGEKTIDDLGAMSDGDLVQWLYEEKGRYDLSREEIDDLLYFIRMESIT
jgi:hypothetical protein